MAIYSNKADSGERDLLHLDKKLGLPPGAMYKLCRRAVVDKSVERKECRVLYKGAIEKMVRVSPRNFKPVMKKIFLIEDGKINGRKVLAQVSLGMEDQSE